MRFLWFILIIVLASIAGLLVAVWPERPLWSMTLPEKISLLRYQPVPGKLIGVAQANGNNQRLMIWNATTGALLDETELFLDSTALYINHIAPDLQSVLVVEQIKPADGEQSKEIRGWSIYDLASGRRRYGPEKNSILNARPWSTDGRYFYSSRVDSRTHQKELTIHSLPSGQAVCKFSPPEGFHSATPHFASDGSTLCLFWQRVEPDAKMSIAGKKVIAFHELPSGKELKRWELPENRLWFGAWDWNGESLLLIELVPNTRIASSKCYHVYPMKADPIQSAVLDPLMSRLEEQRNSEMTVQYEMWPNQVVEYGLIKEDKMINNWFVNARNWLRDKLQPDLSPSRYFVKIFSRPDGNLLYEMDWLVSSPTTFLNDGRLLVTTDITRSESGTRRYEIWRLYPTSRSAWAWMTAFGVAILMLMLWFIKRRFLSTKPPPTSTPSANSSSPAPLSSPPPSPSP